ncbi:hypothetical protein LOK49_LG01G01670 [Camellia lanceoleosa]|uniref:Uncharacterized protein n=1 Tax=Camellia lanceoleosa TaxID=1840588 RepID=A0ACC0IUV1_9ERIC|nr:hypothetical protein LOK49_LG01G01670 [Camellia lanceoleosa]
MGGFLGGRRVSKLLLIQGTLDSLLRGGGNLYSVRDKPMPKAIIELRRGMIGLDAKKQTAEVKDVLDLARCACIVRQDDNDILWKKWHGKETEAKEGMRGFETLSKLLLIQEALNSLLKGGGNLYSIRDKPMPKAMVKLWRGKMNITILVSSHVALGSPSPPPPPPISNGGGGNGGNGD